MEAGPGGLHTSSELSGPAQPFPERVGGKVVEALTTPLLSLLPYSNTAGARTAMCSLGEFTRPRSLIYLRGWGFTSGP